MRCGPEIRSIGNHVNVKNLIASLVLCWCFLQGSAQPSTSESSFEFWISDLDKAMFSRVTYHITSDSIVIKSGPYDFIYFSKNYEKDKVVYRMAVDSSMSKGLLLLEQGLKDYPLKGSYTNLCFIDGLILHFHFESADFKKSTTLSNYYLEMMDPVVEYVNFLVPEEHRIGYDEEWLRKGMKDCPEDKILD